MAKEVKHCSLLLLRNSPTLISDRTPRVPVAHHNCYMERKWVPGDFSSELRCLVDGWSEECRDTLTAAYNVQILNVLSQQMQPIKLIKYTDMFCNRHNLFVWCGSHVLIKSYQSRKQSIFALQSIYQKREWVSSGFFPRNALSSPPIQ